VLHGAKHAATAVPQLRSASQPVHELAHWVLTKLISASPPRRLSLTCQIVIAERRRTST
jgi:hypothetical protein